jgi:hypothetical protein
MSNANGQRRGRGSGLQNRAVGRVPSCGDPICSPRIWENNDWAIVAIDSGSLLSYLKVVESFNHLEQKRLSAPWRKARICARILLKPDDRWSVRDVRLAIRLGRDGNVANRLIDQALAHLKARRISK